MTTQVAKEVRCPACNKLWAKDLLAGVLTVECRCGTTFVVDRRTHEA